MFWFKVPRKRARGRHRKHRHNWWLTLREWLWPSMGIMPMLRWFELRIKRHQSASHRTAMGLALGVGVSFTPFFGLHILIILLLSWLLRANVWVGVVASGFGNPWTFPFITLWTFNIGHFVLGTHHGAEPLEGSPSLTHIWAHFPFFWQQYLWPMTVGGVPTGLVVGVIIYYTMKGSIRRYQRMRLQRIRDARDRHQQKSGSN